MSKTTKGLKKTSAPKTISKEPTAVTKQMGSLDKGAEIIYGYSQAEALRMNIVDAVPSDKKNEFIDAHERIYQDGEIHE